MESQNISTPTGAVVVIGPNGSAMAKPEEGFDFLGVGRSSGYERLNDGTIPSIQIGKLKRIPWSWLYKQAGIIG